MTKRLIRFSLPISILLFSLLFVALFPFYRFIFDPDSIGYSAVAERVASGDFYKSINGLWSPLSSWLVVPFIKLGIDPVVGFKYNNGVISILLLISTWHLLKKITLPEWMKAGIIYTCVPVFLSYCFYELCADFLLLLFFTQYLIQVCSDDFFINHKRQLYCVLFAVLAYLSKAYFFPFFIAHFSIVNIYYFRNASFIEKTKKLFQNLTSGIIAFLLLCSPWIYALSTKYHYLTYSNAGKYNAYLHLHPGTEYSKLLFPLPYPDSYNYWDDPFLPFMKDFSGLSSLKTEFIQVKLIIHNVFYSVPLFAEISFLSLIIIFATLLLCVTKKSSARIPNSITILVITSILVPSGYLLFHLETRFIWMLSILCLSMGAYLLNLIFINSPRSKKNKLIISFVFCLSFFIGPIISLKDNINSGKEEYSIAAQLRNKNISGKFIANYISATQYTSMLMSTVIAKNQFFTFSQIDFSGTDLKEAIKEFGIDYYMFSYNNEFEKESFLSGAFCKEGKSVIADFYPGIILVKLK